jgi:hypothetical protein
VCVRIRCVEIVTSPLKVRERKGRLWAEDAAGQVVVDGRTREHWPERYVAQTASGTCRVAARVEAGPSRYLPVIDATGREMGRIVTQRRQDWVLQLATGEQAMVSGKGGMFAGISCTIGELSSAVAPRLAPQRYITVTLADAVLARPDRDALVVALVWISEMTIASRIGDAGGGD